jgi:DHA2 family multidrug resistance protein-like MFS transporter
VLAGQHVPPATLSVIKASLGDALAVAAKLPGATGQLLGHLARGAFASGLDLGTLAACGVAIVGFLIALIWLPRTRPTGTDVPAAALDAASPDAGQRGLLWALSDTPRQVPAGGPTAGQPSGPPAGATTGRHKP